MIKEMRIFLCLISLLIISGCSSVAKLSSLPQTTSSIDFYELSDRDLSPDHGVWHHRGSSEYLIRIQGYSNSEIVGFIIKALKEHNFRVQSTNKSEISVLGKRGLTWMEWGSVAGVYAKPVGSEYQVYVRVDVTQDITGDVVRNRAKDLSDTICGLAKGCTRAKS